MSVSPVQSGASVGRRIKILYGYKLQRWVKQMARFMTSRTYDFMGVLRLLVIGPWSTLTLAHSGNLFASKRAQRTGTLFDVMLYPWHFKLQVPTVMPLGFPLSSYSRTNNRVHLSYSVERVAWTYFGTLRSQARALTSRRWERSVGSYSSARQCFHKYEKLIVCIQ